MKYIYEIYYITYLFSKFHKYISHDLIIMGDFNIITNDPKPSQLNILINKLGLTPQILQNTRPQFNKCNTSTIDQIYTKVFFYYIKIFLYGIHNG